MPVLDRLTELQLLSKYSQLVDRLGYSTRASIPRSCAPLRPPAPRSSSALSKAEAKQITAEETYAHIPGHSNVAPSTGTAPATARERPSYARRTTAPGARSDYDSAKYPP